MLSLGGTKSFVFARQASARREFSARLAVQKQSFLFSWDSTWPPCDKGLSGNVIILALVTNIKLAMITENSSLLWVKCLLILIFITHSNRKLSIDKAGTVKTKLNIFLTYLVNAVSEGRWKFRDSLACVWDARVARKGRRRFFLPHAPRSHSFSFTFHSHRLPRRARLFESKLTLVPD